MAKMTQDEMQKAARIASQYAYEPGSATKKDSLKKKIAMAIKGKRYKTKAAKRILRKKKKLDEASVESYATRMRSKELRRSMTEEELRKLKGK